MRSQVDRRLSELERVAAPMLGFRYFQQSGADPALFQESGQSSQAFTLGEIDALSAAGWQCIVIGWEMPEDAKDVIRLTWGEGEPAG